MSPFRKTLVLFCLVLAVLVGGLLYQLFRGDGGEAVEILIPRGATVSGVVDTLVKADIVRDPMFFKALLRVTNGAQRVRAGEFRFKKNMRPIDAIFVLYIDEPIVHTVTIPEGWNARQIAQVLASSKLGSEEKFLKIMLSPQSASKYNLKAPTLEGFLYPDTYAFSRVDGEDRVVERMVQRFFKKFDKTLQEEAKAKGFTLEQFVTLASIVEKETGVGGERELVASVFHNRLKKKMRLESDPTTIYGIANFNGNLTKADLKRNTPYNTYTIRGLPPGAISNPGITTMIATLRPPETKYLFFVANGAGVTLFSETYAQHNRYVDEYQRRRRSRKALVEDKTAPKGPPLPRKPNGLRTPAAKR